MTLALEIVEEGTADIVGGRHTRDLVAARCFLKRNTSISVIGGTGVACGPTSHRTSSSAQRNSAFIRDDRNMAKTVGRFDFHVLGGADGEGPPITPMAYITVARRPPLNDGQISITPQMTESEIHTWVDLLREDLEAVAKRVKAAIRRVETPK
ncbi:hypothetical protein ACQKOH_19890 [Sphingomonas sp. NPDC092331]|uniref:hypothetical protein n=1 Tax=unclassified Sphingomonas TaxID=196159 RepID=UPI00380F0648